MRRQFKTAAVAASFLAALSGTALAGQTTSSTKTEKQTLIEAQKELAARASGTKGAARAHYDMDRRRVEGLIDALERGQRVSPDEIERAADEANKPPF